MHVHAYDEKTRHLETATGNWERYLVCKLCGYTPTRADLGMDEDDSSTLFTVVYQSHYTERHRTFATRAAAVQFVAEIMKGESAWPDSIRSGGETLWEQSGPRTTWASLQRFAADNGLPEPSG